MHECSALVVEPPQFASDEFAIPRKESGRSRRLILIEGLTFRISRRFASRADVVQLEIGISLDNKDATMGSEARKRQGIARQVHRERRSSNWIIRGAELQVW